METKLNTLTEAQMYYVEKVRDPKDKQILIAIFEKDNEIVKKSIEKFGISKNIFTFVS